MPRYSENKQAAAQIHVMPPLRRVERHAVCDALPRVTVTACRRLGAHFIFIAVTTTPSFSIEPASQFYRLLAG